MSPKKEDKCGKMEKMKYICRYIYIYLFILLPLNKFSFNFYCMT